MIDYSPFWQTLKESEETTYTLIYKHHISSATIDKLRKNKPMNTTTLNDLCRIVERAARNNRLSWMVSPGKRPCDGRACTIRHMDIC